MDADCLFSFGRRKRFGNNACFYTECIRPHTDATTTLPLSSSNSGTNRAPNTKTPEQEEYNNTGALDL